MLVLLCDVARALVDRASIRVSVIGRWSVMSGALVRKTPKKRLFSIKVVHSVEHHASDRGSR